MYYNVKQIAKSIDLSEGGVYKRIRQLQLKGIKIIDKMYYTPEQVLLIQLDIQEFEIPKVIYHTQTFYIYQSKMNYDI
jgi:DNA-binding Lrp family transcriptional regulator